jgi:hypothetical protein
MAVTRVSSLSTAVASALVAVSAAHGELGWRWEHPQPTSDDLGSVWCSGAGDVYASGYYGTVVRFDGSAWSTVLEASRLLYAVGGSGSADVWAVGHGQIWRFDGERWTFVPGLPAAISWYGVWASSPTDVFVVGEQAFTGRIAHFDGTSWSIASPPGAPPLRKVWGSGPANVYAVGDGAILRYDGSEWADASPPGSLTFTAIAGIDGDFVLAGTANGVVLLGNGESWEPIGVDLGHVTGIATASETRIEISTSEGKIQEWDGTSWTRTGGTEGHALRAIRSCGGDEAFAVGDGGVILVRTGTHWNSASLVPPANLSSAWLDPSGEIFAVGSNLALRYDGTSWTTLSVLGASEPDLRDVWGAAPDDVYAVGNGVFRFDGTAWSKVLSEGFTTGVWGSDEQNVYVVSGLNCFHFDGFTWTDIPIAGQALLMTDVWGSSADDVFIVGSFGNISRFDGTSWQPMSSGVQESLGSVWGSGPTDVWAVGESSVVHFDGTGWQVDPVASGFEALGVFGTGPNDVYLMTPTRVIRFDGSSWRPVEAPGRLIDGAAAVVATGQPGEAIFVGNAGSIARRLALFASGFETFGLCAWSATLPDTACAP